MAVLPSVNHPIDCGIVTTSNFVRQFSKKTVANRAIDLIAQSVDRPIGNSQSSINETIGDALYDKTTYASIVTDCFVSILPVNQSLQTVTSIQSTDESILSNPTENNPNLLAHQANGTCGVLVTLNNSEKAVTSFNAQTKTPSPVYLFLNHLSGSLAHHILGQTTSIADNTTSPLEHYQIYSTFNFTNNVYVKNEGFWGSALDFSGITVNKSGSGGITSVSAITPRHAIGASHYPPEINDIMFFCDENNVTIQRTVVDRRFTDGDTVIVKFNSDLPSTVKKYKFLPSNWKSYLPVDYPDVQTPTMAQLNQVLKTHAIGVPFVVTSHYRWDDEWPLQRSNRYAYIYPSIIRYNVFSGVAQNADIGGASQGIIGENITTFPNYDGSPSGIRGGDSGLPCFYIINDDLVLVMKHHGPASGTFLSDILDGIESAVSLLGSEGHSIQTINLSGFTDFSS